MSTLVICIITEHNSDDANRTALSLYMHLVCHILHRSDEFIVSSEQITHNSLLHSQSTNLQIHDIDVIKITLVDETSKITSVDETSQERRKKREREEGEGRKREKKREKHERKQIQTFFCFNLKTVLTNVQN